MTNTQSPKPTRTPRNILRRDTIISACALINVVVYLVVSALNGGTGFPLDDSWIHQTFARNLAQYGEWAFVHGIPSAASTSPLYTVLLAIGYIARMPYFVWAFALGAIALTICGLVGARLAERVFPETARIGLWVGLLIVFEWHLVWAAAAGMETIVFIALSELLIWLVWREFYASLEV